MSDLTESQEKVFKALKEYIEEHHFAPTIRELANMVGKNSTGTIHASLTILKRKGYIDYQYNKNRTITILKELNDGKSE